MQAKKTLYDLLEVNPGASQSTIRAAWERLSELHSQARLHSKEGLSDEAHFNLVKDAWYTLSDENRRAVYDARIFGRTDSPLIAEPVAEGLSGRAKLVMLLVVIGIAAWGYKWHTDVEKERLRIAATQLRLQQEALAQEAQRLALEAEREAEREARQARQEEERLARIQTEERERAIREADRNSRELESAAARYQREDQQRQREEERRRQQADMQRERQAREAAEATRRLENQARRNEYENQRSSPLRGGGIPQQSSSLSNR